MRFNVACAIVDLKWDTWEFIRTHFLSNTVRAAPMAGSESNSISGEQPDSEFDGHPVASVRRSHSNCSVVLQTLR